MSVSFRSCQAVRGTRLSQRFAAFANGPGLPGACVGKNANFLTEEPLPALVQPALRNGRLEMNLDEGILLKNNPVEGNKGWAVDRFGQDIGR